MRHQEPDDQLMVGAQLARHIDSREAFAQVQVKAQVEVGLASECRGAIGVLHEHHRARRGDSPPFVAFEDGVCLALGAAEVVRVDDDHCTGP